MTDFVHWLIAAISFGAGGFVGMVLLACLVASRESERGTEQ